MRRPNVVAQKVDNPSARRRPSEIWVALTDDPIVHVEMSGFATITSTVPTEPAVTTDDLGTQTQITATLPGGIDRQLHAIESRVDGSAPSPRSMQMVHAVALLAVRRRMKIDRVVALPEGGVVIYIFGGEPNKRGTHPRHVGIVADNEEDCLSVFMRDRQKPNSDYFDIADVDSALGRIARFIRG